MIAENPHELAGVHADFDDSILVRHRHNECIVVWFVNDRVAVRPIVYRTLDNALVMNVPERLAQ